MKEDVTTSGEQSELAKETKVAADNGVAVTDVEMKDQEEQGEEEEKQMIGGCCVCSDENGYTNNQLVYCDGARCQVAVHQACYGIVIIPEGSWYCAPCEYKRQLVISKSDNKQQLQEQIVCQFCPCREGALQRTDTGKWAHVVCALYVPEIEFGNTRTMEPIVTKDLDPERYGKKCSICETTTTTKTSSSTQHQQSVYVNCKKSNCKNWFHVTCAQVEGLLCEESSPGRVNYLIYCKSHINKINNSLVKRIPPFKFYTSIGKMAAAATATLSSSKKKSPTRKRESSGGGGKSTTTTTLKKKKVKSSENESQTSRVANNNKTAKSTMDTLIESVVKEEVFEENLNYVYDIQDSKDPEPISGNSSVVKSEEDEESRVKKKKKKDSMSSSLSSPAASTTSSSNKRKIRGSVETDELKGEGKASSTGASSNNKKQKATTTTTNKNTSTNSSLLSPPPQPLTASGSSSGSKTTKKQQTVVRKSNETNNTSTTITTTNSMLTPPPSVPYQHQSSSNSTTVSLPNQETTTSQATLGTTTSIDIFGNYLVNSNNINGGVDTSVVAVSKSVEPVKSESKRKETTSGVAATAAAVEESIMTVESYLASGDNTTFPETMDELLRWQFTSTETLANEAVKKLDIMDFLSLIQESQKEKEELAKRLQRLQAENEQLTQLNKKWSATSNNNTNIIHLPTMLSNGTTAVGSSNQTSISRSNSDTQVNTGVGVANSSSSSSAATTMTQSTSRSPSVNIPMSYSQLQQHNTPLILNHKPPNIQAHSPISSSSPSPVKAANRPQSQQQQQQLSVHHLNSQALMNALLNNQHQTSPGVKQSQQVNGHASIAIRPDLMHQQANIINNNNSNSLSMLSQAAQIISEPGFNGAASSNGGGGNNNNNIAHLIQHQIQGMANNHQITAFLANNFPGAVGGIGGINQVIYQLLASGIDPVTISNSHVNLYQNAAAGNLNGGNRPPAAF